MVIIPLHLGYKCQVRVPLWAAASSTRHIYFTQWCRLNGGPASEYTGSSSLCPSVYIVIATSAQPTRDIEPMLFHSTLAKRLYTACCCWWHRRWSVHGCHWRIIRHNPLEWSIKPAMRDSARHAPNVTHFQRPAHPKNFAAFKNCARVPKMLRFAK